MARRIVVLTEAFVLFAALVLLSPSQLYGQRPRSQQPIGGGVTTQALGGGGGCEFGCGSAIAYGYISSPGDYEHAAESGPHTYQITVKNIGTASGEFVVTCVDQSQLPCLTPSPEVFYLAAGGLQVVTVGYNTMGIGAFGQNHVIASGLSTKTVTKSGIVVTANGGAIVSHLEPLDGGVVVAGDSLRAIMGHASGINVSAVTVLIDGSDYSTQAVVTSSGYSLAPILTAGSHTWQSTVCAMNGRCDTVHTSFDYIGSINPSLDDSLPMPSGAEPLFGLLPGALPLPPLSYRGCPVIAGDPEIRLSGPVSYLSQPGSSGAPGGLIFMAGVETTQTITISTLTIDHKPTDGTTCAGSFTYLEWPDYDWSFWEHSDYSDEPLWESYKYGDFDLPYPWYATSAGAESWTDVIGEYAYTGQPVLPPNGPNPGEHFADAMSRRAKTLPMSTPTSLGRNHSGVLKVPDPGAIDPSSLKLVLNGTSIVVNGVSIVGTQVTVVSLDRYGQQVDIDPNYPGINSYDPSNSAANNGGWNELIATISDSSGNSSSVRSRWVRVGAGNPAPLTLTALRDFEHASQSDCAAFGAFQCGGVFMAQTIPGFVSRDKDRSLHLVYRSNSQRGPTIVPLEVGIDRLQKAPDSLWVFALEGTARASDTLRYSGLLGNPGGYGSNPLWEHADEQRVVGVELDPPTGNIAIRHIDVVVRSFYSSGAPREDIVSQDVVQTTLSDTTMTRFGPGWQLAELGRLHLGLTYNGSPAIIWSSGDGSYVIFRNTNGTWQAPAGFSTQLTQLTTAENGATYVISLPSGERIGFSAAGLQRWTSDLLLNRTLFDYSGGDRLTYITVPSGARYALYYDSPVAGQVQSIRVQEPGGQLRLVGGVFYDASTRAMTELRIYQSATASTSTFFGYVPGAPGSYLTSITDALGQVSTIAYDPVLYTPERITGPADRFGPSITEYRSSLRRAVPRVGYGRGSAPLARILYPSQQRATLVNNAGDATDVLVDAFGAPTYVLRVNPDLSQGAFLASANDERHIERDASGRVTKIVHQRFIPSVTDSVMYHYDALGRIDTIFRPNPEYPRNGPGVLATSFTYDSVTIGTPAASGGAWCSRMLQTRDVMGGLTRINYGTSGAAKCLPMSTVGLANDTTLFTYGPLTAGDPAATRPVSIKDPNGLTTYVTYDSNNWNSESTARAVGGPSYTSYYDLYGRIDSVVDPVGTHTVVLHDYTGRVTHSKTGTGLNAPVTRNTYDAVGRIVQADVYAAEDGVLDTPTGTVQSTRYYYDPLGQLDSIVGPGSRSPTKAARKQSWLRDRRGNPIYEFPGNGSYIGRIYDGLGRLVFQEQSQVSSTMSADGEPLADAATLAFYDGLNMSMGPNLSAGQRHYYSYDQAGNLIGTTSYDEYLDSATPYVSKTYTYAPGGVLLNEGIGFSDGVAVSRAFEYNQRGQRTKVTDTVTTGGAVLPEGIGVTTYTYDSTTGRMTAQDATVGAATIGRISWLYDRGGRETSRSVRIGLTGQTLTTTTSYDGLGRVSEINTQAPSAKTWYRYYSPSLSNIDELLAFSVTQGLSVGSSNYSNVYTYAPNGTRRLLSSQRNSYLTSAHNYTYDVFGNRKTELSTYNSGNQCEELATLSYGSDNRLESKDFSAVCNDVRYYNDQTGNRLAEEVLNSGGIQQSVHRMSYTAARQLYFSFTTTNSVGQYDVNWHWYDAGGKRVITHRTTTGSWFPRGFDPVMGTRTYYIYDGSDIALTVVGQNGTFSVRQRFLVGGVDQPLLGRFRDSGYGTFENLALVGDRQGSTVAAVKEDGNMELQSTYYSTDAFGGADDGGATPGDVSTGTGYTGASTPNANGGFVYLRNRWYDPQTGRFLTQDPIGLAGGVNLYAYAGNNPVAFTDPFGLMGEECNGEEDGAKKECDENESPKDDGNSQVNYIGYNATIIAGAGWTIGVGYYEISEPYSGNPPSGFYLRVGYGTGLDVNIGSEGGAAGSLSAFRGAGETSCGGIAILYVCKGSNNNGSTLSGGGSIGPTEVYASGHVEESYTFITTPTRVSPATWNTVSCMNTAIGLAPTKSCR